MGLVFGQNRSAAAAAAVAFDSEPQFEEDNNNLDSAIDKQLPWEPNRQQQQQLTTANAN